MLSYRHYTKGTEDKLRAVAAWSALGGTLGELVRPCQDTEKLSMGERH